jgi:hypothetical protein
MTGCLLVDHFLEGWEEPTGWALWSAKFTMAAPPLGEGLDVGVDNLTSERHGAVFGAGRGNNSRCGCEPRSQSTVSGSRQGITPVGFDPVSVDQDYDPCRFSGRPGTREAEKTGETRPTAQLPGWVVIYHSRRRIPLNFSYHVGHLMVPASRKRMRTTNPADDGGEFEAAPSPKLSGRLSDRPVVFALAPEMTEPQLNGTRPCRSTCSGQSAFSMGRGSAIEENMQNV